MRRGEIWLVKIPQSLSSIQDGLRPMILISNNMCLLHSSVIHAIPTTTKKKKWLPTHVEIPTSCGLLNTSIALCEQSMLLSKEKFIKCVGECDFDTLFQINQALIIQFDLSQLETKIKNIKIS